MRSVSASWWSSRKLSSINAESIHSPRTAAAGCVSTGDFVPLKTLIAEVGPSNQTADFHRLVSTAPATKP
jgi:hypothetical protein